jgi:hypothetical protein
LTEPGGLVRVLRSHVRSRSPRGTKFRELTRRSNPELEQAWIIGQVVDSTDDSSTSYPTLSHPSARREKLLISRDDDGEANG